MASDTDDERRPSVVSIWSYAGKLDHRRTEQVGDAVLDPVDDGREFGRLGIQLDRGLRQHPHLVSSRCEKSRLALQRRCHLVDAVRLHRDLLAELGVPPASSLKELERMWWPAPHGFRGATEGRHSGEHRLECAVVSCKWFISGTASLPSWSL
jgi:hypothetical protein